MYIYIYIYIFIILIYKLVNFVNFIKYWYFLFSTFIDLLENLPFYAYI